jgi:hypothetical protein
MFSKKKLALCSSPYFVGTTNVNVLKMKLQNTVIFDSQAKTAIIMRDGIYHYSAAEVGDSSLPANAIVKVYRDKAEVEKALNRFKELQKLPLTVYHPKEFLDLQNADSFKEGVAENPFLELKQNYTVLGCKLAMNDAATSLYEKGQRQLSCGWEGEFVKVADKEYDYEQKFIDFNHIAILPNGRAGSLCSIIDNNLNVLEMTTKNVEELKSEIKETVKDALTEFSDKKEKVEKEKEIQKKEKELEAEEDEIESDEESEEMNKKDKKKKTKDAAIAVVDAAVADARSALIADFSSVFSAIEKGIIAVKDCAGKEPAEIKQAVVEKLLKKKIDLKDAIVLDAHYCVALENYSHPSWAASNAKVVDSEVASVASLIKNFSPLDQQFKK